MTAAEVELAGRPRWRGQPGRLEVHYVTATDESTGAGLWVHCEVVSPTSGTPYGHGWVALFPPTGAPRYERFGPEPVAPRPPEAWFRSGDVTLSATNVAGAAGDVGWDLRWESGERPLWTFPRWAWQRNVLPAAQVVPEPATRVTGTVAGMPFDGPGAVAHIYGHGNAQRWCWLHADLGGGDVVELVAATARRPGLRLLPPLPLVRLRVDGEDWPGDPLAAALLSTARLRDEGFGVVVRSPGRRLRIDVAMPADRCVQIGYTDPDGETATCTNTERADVAVRLDEWTRRGWRTKRDWALDATGHAELGRRP